jgi:hypothetical protein
LVPVVLGIVLASTHELMFEMFGFLAAVVGSMLTA